MSGCCDGTGLFVVCMDEGVCEVAQKRRPSVNPALVWAPFFIHPGFNYPRSSFICLQSGGTSDRRTDREGCMREWMDTVDSFFPGGPGFWRRCLCAEVCFFLKDEQNSRGPGDILFFSTLFLDLKMLQAGTEVEIKAFWNQALFVSCYIVVH